LKQYGRSLNYSKSELEQPETLRNLQNLQKFFTTTESGEKQRQFVASVVKDIRESFIPPFVYDMDSAKTLSDSNSKFEEWLLKDTFTLVSKLVENHNMTEKEMKVDDRKMIKATIMGQFFFQKNMKQEQLIIPQNLKDTVTDIEFDTRLLEFQLQGNALDQKDEKTMNNFYLQLGCYLFPSIDSGFKSFEDIAKNNSW
jgi:hypothetical protein